MTKEHRDERRVTMLKERFEADLERLLKYATAPDGRPMFHVLLTDDEQLDRWLNPETRLAAEESVLRRGSQAELHKYRERMLSLSYRRQTSGT